DEQSSYLRKIKQLESLIGTQRKEKMIRQTVNLELILKTCARVKSFSSIEIDDIHQLAIKNGDDLIFKNDIALKPSKLFENLMERIFRHWNLSLESARRTIQYTQSIISNPKILTLKSLVYYLTAERSEPTVTSLQAGQSLPNNCVFCAIEAKKDESFAQ
ncbi:18680_t:CDS:2, partial [Gigaspora rosea]